MDKARLAVTVVFYTAHIRRDNLRDERINILECLTI
jgi:hypothetical protein